jgi:hypothetical protein
MCGALGVNRRTLHIALYCLGVWWRSEQLRGSAARAGREFSTSDHSRHGKLKPYSIVAARNQKINQTFAIRRNYGRINQILAQAGIDTWQQPASDQVNLYPVQSDISASASSAQDVVQYLEKAVLLGVRNGWTEERRKAQGEKMRQVWEMRKKSG